MAEPRETTSSNNSADETRDDDLRSEGAPGAGDTPSPDGIPDPSGWPARRQSSRSPLGERPLAPGLYLVATPIGNLADITFRAVAVLAAVDAIACEDTRVTSKLLAAYGIRRPLIACHEHNERQQAAALVARMAAGERIALVSDAGTPLLSDPGFPLVRACLDAGLPVEAIPGPSAPIAALAVSGLPCDRFLFAGFPPPRSSARRRFAAELAAVPATLILLESPHRLAESLADLADILGNRPAAVARELTKRFEEVRRAPLAELADRYRREDPPRGEITIVIGPPLEGDLGPAVMDDAALDELLRAALAETTVKQAVARVAAETGLPRRRVYARALAVTAEAG